MSVFIAGDRFCTPFTMQSILHDCRFSGGISASGQSAGFGGNLFTRDTCRVLRDVIHIPQMQSFVRQMLVTLLQWQGIKHDDTTNESPDALQHQVFRQIIGGIRLNNSVVEQAEYWTSQWGVPMTDSPETGKQFVIYNSSDGPPLYLITLCEYIQYYGRDVLGDTYMHWPTGKVRTVADGAQRCIDFVLRRITNGEEIGHGLYGVPNTNPLQTSPSGVMRDGFDAYVTQGGEPADYGSMVYLENQALVHEALYLASRWLSTRSRRVDVWEAVADTLAERTIDQLWMENDQFFAAGMDKFGIVDMISSCAFELLDSPFFHEIDDGPDYIQALVHRLYSPDFMTPIGCRMTSLVHAKQEGEYAPYQGSSAVWGVTNGLIERGLRRQGLATGVEDIGQRLIGWFNAAHEAYEMTFVDANGKVVFHPEQVLDGRDVSNRSVLYPSEFGQPNQAWSASAALRILTSPYHQSPPSAWRKSLNRTLSDLVRQTPMLDRISIADEQPLLDLRRGKQLKEQRRNQLAQAATCES